MKDTRVISWGMCVAAFLGCVLFSSSMSPVMAQANPSAITGETFVPGNYRPLRTLSGEEYNIQQGGMIQQSNRGGGASILSNVMLLQMNQEHFYNHQVLMSSDGLEMILPGQQPMNGLTVVRRVRMNPKDGVLRYLEVLTNPLPSDVSTYVEIVHNFNGNYQNLITSRGRENPNGLEKKETGVYIQPRSPGMKGLLLGLTSSRNPTQISFNNQGNRYQLIVSYQVVVPANGTIALMHTLSQDNLGAKPDQAALTKAFKTVDLSRQMKDVHSKLRPLVVNVRSGTQSFASGLESNHVDQLGVDRNRQDILAIGEATRLPGVASCSSLSIQTRFGVLQVPFEEVLGIVGPKSQLAGGSRVFLKGNQVLAGALKAENFKLILTGGSTMDLSIDNLDRFVRAKDPAEMLWPEGVAALIETSSGDRIAVKDFQGTKFRIATRWGEVEVPGSELRMISSLDEEASGSWVELKDGTRFTGFLVGGEIPLETNHFGTRPFRPQELHGLYTSEVFSLSSNQAQGSGLEFESMHDEPQINQSWATLVGKQNLVARLDVPTLRIGVGGEAVDLSPSSIRELENISEEKGVEPGAHPIFRVKLWGEGEVEGVLQTEALQLQVRGNAWLVPARDLLKFVNPLAQVPESVQKRIVELIRDLGSDEWKVRENATAELENLGYMAKGLLQETGRSSRDPEVQRRVEQILNKLN